MSETPLRQPIKLTPQRERELSVAAGVDPRTARKVLAGGRTTSTTHARVKDAAAKMGIVVPDQEPEPREEKAR